MPKWRVIRTANLLHWQVVDGHRVRLRDEKGEPMKFESHAQAKACADRLNRKEGGAS